MLRVWLNNMVTSKCHKMYEKYQFCGARFSFNFGFFNNDKPTTPSPLSKMLWDFFRMLVIVMNVQDPEVQDPLVQDR